MKPILLITGGTSPSCTISASPSRVEGGNSTTLTWVSNNAASASLSGTGSVQTTSSQTLTPSDTTTYTLTVTAANGSTARCSATVTVPPMPPTHPVATAVSASEIDLSWDASASPPAGAFYQIFRNGYSDVYTTTTGATFVDTNVIANATYSYVIKKVDSLGIISAASASAVATTLNGPYVGTGDIVSGATAYWGLRGYNAAYTGKAANMCRASDGQCEDVYILGSGALDVATAATFCASTTCTVKTLYDQTGNGRDATQTTAAKQPTLTLNCIGSFPCLTFGGAQFLSYATGLTLAQPFSYSAVAMRTSAFTSYGTVLSNNASTVALYFANTANNVKWYPGGSGTAATANENTWHALQGVANGVSSALVVDGISTAASGTGGLSSTTLFIGGTNTNSYLNGTLTEAGIWPVAFTQGQISSMTANESNYWGFGTVTVPTAPTATLSANPMSITSGQKSTLTWSSTNATSCTGTNFTPSGTSGTLDVYPTITTTYSITCTGAGGSASDSKTVTVTSASDTTPPTVPTGLSGNPFSQTQINLSWTASSDNVGGTGVAGYNIYRCQGASARALVQGDTGWITE